MSEVPESISFAEQGRLLPNPEEEESVFNTPTYKDNVFYATVKGRLDFFFKNHPSQPIRDDAVMKYFQDKAYNVLYTSGFRHVPQNADDTHKTASLFSVFKNDVEPIRIVNKAKTVKQVELHYVVVDIILIVHSLSNPHLSIYDGLYLIEPDQHKLTTMTDTLLMQFGFRKVNMVKEQLTTDLRDNPIFVAELVKRMQHKTTIILSYHCGLLMHYWAVDTTRKDLYTVLVQPSFILPVVLVNKFQVRKMVWPVDVDMPAPNELLMAFNGRNSLLMEFEERIKLSAMAEYITTNQMMKSQVDLFNAAFFATSYDEILEAKSSEIAADLEKLSQQNVYTFTAHAKSAFFTVYTTLHLYEQLHKMFSDGDKELGFDAIVDRLRHAVVDDTRKVLPTNEKMTDEQIKETREYARKMKTSAKEFRETYLTVGPQEMLAYDKLYNCQLLMVRNPVVFMQCLRDNTPHDFKLIDGISTNEEKIICEQGLRIFFKIFSVKNDDDCYKPFLVNFMNSSSKE